MSKKRYGALFGGMLVGTVAGAAAGIWLSSRRHQRIRYLTRKSTAALPEIAEDVSTSMQLRANRLSHVVHRRWDSFLGRLQEAVAVGVEVAREEFQTNEQLDKTDGIEPTHPSDTLESETPASEDLLR
jgi:gas vesicle protein